MAKPKAKTSRKERKLMRQVSILTVQNDALRRDLTTANRKADIVDSLASLISDELHRFVKDEIEEQVNDRLNDATVSF